jgi:hypothetical protein
MLIWRSLGLPLARHAVKWSTWGVPLFLAFGVGFIWAGVCTHAWLHQPIQPTPGVLEAHWERPDGLGVACVSLVRAIDGHRVNLTTSGPCGPVDHGITVVLCQPRNRPEEAGECDGKRHCGDGSCETNDLALMIVGWVLATPAMLAVLVCAASVLVPQRFAGRASAHGSPENAVQEQEQEQEHGERTAQPLAQVRVQVHPQLIAAIGDVPAPLTPRGGSGGGSRVAGG